MRLWTSLWELRNTNTLHLCWVQSNGWNWFPLCYFACRCSSNPWMISPTPSGHFGSTLEGHMRPFGLSFTFGLPSKCLGSIGESSRLWWWVASVLRRCQADRPMSCRPARQGRVGDFPGDITFPSGLQIGWSKCPFRSSRWALQHGGVQFGIW